MRVSLFRDIPEENFCSMERYADELSAGLLSLGQLVTPVLVHKTKIIRPFRPVLRLLPWLKNYANDLYFLSLIHI